MCVRIIPSILSSEATRMAECEIVAAFKINTKNQIKIWNECYSFEAVDPGKGVWVEKENVGNA